MLSHRIHLFQKQPFADVLLNRCFQKFHRKTPVLRSFFNKLVESLFNKVAGLLVCNFIIKWLQHNCFSVRLDKFSRLFFLIKHLRSLLFFFIFTALPLALLSQCLAFSTPRIFFDLLRQHQRGLFYLNVLSWPK